MAKAIPLPPGITNRPFALRKFILDPLGFLDKMAREYGDVSTFAWGPFRASVFNHPSLVREMLLTNIGAFEQAGLWGRNKRRFGQSFFVLEGEEHHQHRRMLGPGFAQGRIEDYAEIVLRELDVVAGAWREGQIVDMRHEMTLLTLLVICNALFASDLDEEAKAVVTNLHDAHTHFSNLNRSLVPLVSLLPMGPAHRQYRAEADLDATLKRLIALRRASSEERKDVLDALIRVRSGSGEGMSDKLVKDDLVSLFWVGHETSANSLAWTWHAMTAYPDVQTKIVAEIEEVIGDRPVRYEDLAKLTYMRRVVHEVLRLYPTIYTVVRRPIEDYTVEHEGRRHRIPKGSYVIASQYLLQRDPRFWRDPEVFDPDRWTPERAAEVVPNTYFPFGAGQRHCLGEGMAWMEIMLTLAALLPRWRAVPATSEPVQPQAGLTLQPMGLKLKLESRTSSLAGKSGAPVPAYS